MTNHHPPGFTTYPNAVERQNDQASQSYRGAYPRPWYFVSTQYCVHEYDNKFANRFHSASIATLIRVKFLSGLTETSDLLCEPNWHGVLQPSSNAR